MADIRIKIDSEADTTAIENTKAGLENLKKESGQAAGAISSVGTAVSKINPQLGTTISSVGAITNGVKGLAVALRAMIATPVGMLLTGIAAAAIAAKAAYDYLADSAEKATEKMKRIAGIQLENTLENINHEYRVMAENIKEAADEADRLQKLQRYNTQTERIREDAAAGDRPERDRLVVQGQRAVEDAEADVTKGRVAYDTAKKNLDALNERYVAELTAGADTYKTEEELEKARKAVDDARQGLAALIDRRDATKTYWDEKVKDFDYAEVIREREETAAAGAAGGEEATRRVERAKAAQERVDALTEQRDEILAESTERFTQKGLNAGGGYVTGGGFLTANAKTAAQFSTTYTAENKAQATREKSLERLNKQIDLLQDIADKINEGASEFA